MARDTKKSGGGSRRRLWLALVALAVVTASAAWAGASLRRFALNDPQFTLSRERRDSIMIHGLHFTSRAKVQRVFAEDFDRSVFAVPVAERRRRLLALDWVEDASVSRLWPHRLLVRVRERQPVAFVFFGSGVLLIDPWGVLLSPPAQSQFTFPVLSGVREEEPESQRAERVRALLRVEQELGARAKELSEVNAADLENIRIVTQADGRAVELIMGDGDFGRRFQFFLDHYAEIQKRSPAARTFDLRLDDRITVKE